MSHATPLIATMVAGLVLAFAMGGLAFRMKLPPLVGYLLAGVIVGPFTPGYVADQKLATELAELGVILLMFGVGLHFSVKDLMAVKAIAIPGAVVQIAVAVLLGMGLAEVLGWNIAAGFVFGLALSVASTVVLLRALQERRILDTERGRIAVGWLIVEDLVMVLALVLLPAIAGGSANLGVTLLITVGKVIAFVAFMLVVGRWAIPWLLHVVAHSGSRELFRLAVLAVALGVAFGAAMLFGVSFALGAFFAGMILAESPLSQRAAEETLPLRDAFAVLFFVSVGMLFNPHVLVQAPWALLATVAIIVVGKSIAAFCIVLAFGRPMTTALTISASLAQIGEFSFILATLGLSFDLIPRAASDLILAGAIISIILNPLIFSLVDRIGAARGKPVSADPPKPKPQGHVVLIGYGRVGRSVGERLLAEGRRLIVFETAEDIDNLPQGDTVELIVGNASRPELLARADLAAAQILFVAISETFEAGQIVEQARRINPRLSIIARAHSRDEVAYLKKLGADMAIMGEEEIARRMIAQVVGTAKA